MSILPALKKEEIEVVAQYDQSPYQRELFGTRIILHVKGQTVGAILDRTFGMNWRKETTIIPIGSEHLMKVTLSLKDPDTGEWISRDGIGSPNTFGKKVFDRSLSESAKAEETDCLKRAAYEFGLGRELRTDIDLFFPNQWINWKEDKEENRMTYDRFIVGDITYDIPDSPGRKIVSVTIRDETTGREKTYSVNEEQKVEIAKKETPVENKQTAEEEKKVAETAVFFIPGQTKKTSEKHHSPATKKAPATKEVILDFGKYKGQNLIELVNSAPSFAYWVYKHAPKGSESVKAEALRIGKENPDCRKYFIDGGVKM